MKATIGYRWIIALPLLYSLLFPLVNLFYVESHSQELSGSGQSLLSMGGGRLLWASLLLFFPNSLLSFFLMTFRRSYPESTGKAFFLCLFSLIGGTLPVMGIYFLYYSDLAATGNDITGLMYGFPMVYLLGMMTAWFVGLILTQLRK